MGFGLLLCAYFLFTFMSVGIGDYCFATYIIGAMVAYAAASKLKDYNPRFSWLYPFTLLYGILAVYYAAVTLNNVFWWDLPIGGENTVDRVIADSVRVLTEVGFSVMALWSAGELALTVGLDKHHGKAKRNLIFVAVGAIVQVTVVILQAIPAVRNFHEGDVVSILFAVGFVLQLVIFFLNSLFFYSCFSAICPKGEEFGKPSKPSRFKFINEINRKLDEKNEQARQEYERNLADTNKKYSAKNNDRHHKKKK